MVAQVAPAFVQQILVHGMLFIDRDQMTQLARDQVGALGAHIHHGATLNLEAVIHGIRIRVEDRHASRDLRAQSMLAHVSAAQAIDRPGQQVALHAATRSHAADGGSLVILERGIATYVSWPTCA